LPVDLAAAAMLAPCRDLIVRADFACVAAKPRLACFERLGVLRLAPESQRRPK
jgi:hypothetical protein